MADDDLNAVKTEVELLKRDMSNVQNFLSRLDTAIDKIADVSNGISKILAVHEQSMNSIINDVNLSKITSEKEYDLIHKRINDMKEETNAQRQKNHAEIMEAFDKFDKKHSEQFNSVNARVSTIEKWRHWVLGAVAASGFFVAEAYWFFSSSK
jgi:DNA anti-recombination protein RmuC